MVIDRERYAGMLEDEKQMMGRDCTLLDAATLRDGDVEATVILYETEPYTDPIVNDKQMIERRVAMRVGNHRTSGIADTRWEQVS